MTRTVEQYSNLLSHSKILWPCGVVLDAYDTPANSSAKVTSL